ncbi:glycoside hydrolase family 25 protein [Flavobacterium sp. UMI-01]|uniref:glycoside hydrolase family 25 protein n=1 Tax=Flavobacterium sp. UMI-01 TaxID=1441053 RepID=UPI001C7DFB71|nr:glycoside hydrolase family 25 protein [Flavobacterium sp. UMI-01]GIZ07473.1 glycosyl hydrolase [Flavobacterium sp. UMI-01]
MRKRTVTRKTVVKRKKKTTSPLYKKGIRFLRVGLVCAFLMAMLYHYRNGLAYYFSFKTDKVLAEKAANKRLSDIRNHQVLEKVNCKSVGIDVSEYQGEIQWDEMGSIEEEFPIHFVFIRATVGCDRLDKKFKRNWKSAKEQKLIRGAYHYYRPNENSIAQADLFIKTVQLKKGDLPPVVDLERLSDNQSMERLKLGLRRWLERVEAHYKVRPIIYTGEKYYLDFLKKEFSDYLFWIANYNFYRENIEEDWLFWQFTEKASVAGINGNVDVNIFNGDLQQLQFITVD